METIVAPYAVRSFTIIVHEAEEGGYWGEILELPGCVSQGETLDEFRYNIREALEAVLDARSQEYNIILVVDSEDIDQEFIQLGTNIETWTSTT